MSQPLEVAVIGVGVLGERHARIYSELETCRLSAIVDVDESRANEVARRYDCAAYTSVEALLATRPPVRAVSVATPTREHRNQSVQCLRAGIDVLVEKPIASSREEGSEMLSVAEEHGRILGVGHTERHNPAVEALLRDVGSPRFLEIHRLGSFSPRSLDIDVVLDLMIHDLDVVAALVPAEVVSIDAVGVPVLTPRVDIANARLRFSSGAVANLTASRVSQEKIRKLRVFEPHRYVSLDYMAQKAVSFHLEPGDKGARPEIVRRELSVELEEPLRRELKDFVGAVRERRAPLVAGVDGLRALDMSLRVIESMDRQAASGTS